MGDVVAFRPRASGRGPGPKLPAEETGRILLYTGVRYERREEAAPRPRTARPRKPRRRRA